MKTKLEMAHEFSMKLVGNPTTPLKDMNSIMEASWKYADAMQAEADKRENEEQDKLEQNERNHHDELVSIGLEKWQPDWSQAPDWANWWVATADHDGKIFGGWFYDVRPELGVGKGSSIYYSSNSKNILTDSFGYTGDWRESLRKRPK